MGKKGRREREAKREGTKGKEVQKRVTWEREESRRELDSGKGL